MTGYPRPIIAWGKAFGNLPRGKVQSNNSVMRLINVQKNDSGDFVCTATNLLGSAVKKTLLVVISPPRFTVKPPVKAVTMVENTLTLNCSATGDSQPVISWKRQGAQLPVGRSQQINGALVIRNIIRNEDAGNYNCVAKITGIAAVETGTYVEVKPKGKLS